MRTVSVDYKRYVGAQLGVYKPKGPRVGAISHLNNVEYLFLAGKLPDELWSLRIPPQACSCFSSDKMSQF